MSAGPKRRARRRDKRIAHLMQTPPGETVEQQHARCDEYGRLVLARLKDSKRTAYDMALAAEREPHWWRNVGFVLGNTP
jgi:hypothetical protein